MRSILPYKRPPIHLTLIYTGAALTAPHLQAGWLRFSFPLMYQTDVLEILDILTGLGIKDSRMDQAVDLVLSKQDDMGRWRIENTCNSDRLLVPFGKKGEQSKWLTLRAMRVLKRYNT